MIRKLHKKMLVLLKHWQRKVLTINLMVVEFMIVSLIQNIDTSNDNCIGEDHILVNFPVEKIRL